MPRRDNRPATTITGAIAIFLLTAAVAAGSSRADEAAAAKAVVEAFEAASVNMHAGMAAPLSGDADRDFVTAMIPHHQGAIDMAKIVLEHGQDPQIKALARDIIDAQSEEIAVLEAWLASYPAAGEAQAPYAGLEQRRIKALSARQIDDLRAGRGMGLALAAELNGYPGPTHVLDLADDLSLKPEQIAETATIRTKMSDEAAQLGAEILRREEALDRLFASGAAESEELRRQVAELARLGGELRFVHLNTHLAMRRLLTPEQVAAYARLRGYGAEDGDSKGHHGQHGSQ
ncbi:CopM family metallochaperone [Rhodospirillaceae bacterium SYSU D60014]|uniref:CopM family metallochaperone n=1 Tax=Virgifigura deserti TaxID=2268457 RepID=UPI000E667365